jgi:hypothetical protein
MQREAIGYEMEKQTRNHHRKLCTTLKIKNEYMEQK